jgi:hypothetical protein
MLIDDVTDLHVHGSPSLVARHASDADTVAGNASVGVSLSVLKAHEGSTAERALLVGDGAVGGVVLNSIVGGANPDAVEVAARLGGRVVWLPTISAPAHRAAMSSPELAVHRGVELREVPVVVDGRLDPPWHEVLEVVAAHDLVLASGHLTCAEALVLFAEARAHGVRRLLFNHPVLPFLDWDAAAAPRLAELGVNLELSILPDLLVDGRGPTSHDLAVSYPTELLVFGGDLGHADHPTLREALPSWLGQLASRLGDTDTEAIMTGNGRRLVTP